MAVRCEIDSSTTTSAVPINQRSTDQLPAVISGRISWPLNVLEGELYSFLPNEYFLQSSSLLQSPHDDCSGKDQDYRLISNILATDYLKPARAARTNSSAVATQDGNFYPAEAYTIAAATAWPDVLGDSLCGDPVESLFSVGEDVLDGVVEKGASKGKIILLETFSCKNQCTGKFYGHHKCYRNGASVRIECSEDKCSSMFRSKNDFNRHVKSVHLGKPNVQIMRFNCNAVGCTRVGKRGFERRDNLLQHLRRVHGLEIPKVKFRFGASDTKDSGDSISPRNAK